MTVTSLPVRDEYTATAAQTVFNYTFLIFTDQDLNVYITPSGQDANDATDITTAYTVDPGTIGNSTGGFITLNSGVSAGDLITIVSDMAEDRTVDYQDSGDFLPAVVNGDFDRVVSLVKQIEDRAARTLAFAESLQNATSLTMPFPEAGKYVVWKGDLTGLENTGAPGVLIPSELTGTSLNMIADATLIIGDYVQTTGRSSAGDGGDCVYEIVAGSTGTDDGGSFLDLDNGLQAKAHFPGGRVTGPQFGMIPAADSTAAYHNAVTYVSTNGLELDLLGATYIYDIAVSAIGVVVDGFDNWKIHNGTLERTGTFTASPSQNATIHHVKNCDNWEGDLIVTGPATAFTGVNPISTQVAKGYLVFWVELGCDNFKVKVDISDNFGGILTGSGPATTSDGSVTNFEVDIRAYAVEYGSNHAQRGDNAKIRIYAEKCHRAYFPYGIDNHDVDVTTVSPGTVTAAISVYNDDTTNIRGSFNITYTGDGDSRASLNGGVDIKTLDTHGTSGKIDGIDIKVYARSLNGGVFGSQNYRPVVGFSSSGASQRIQNVYLDVDIEGWEGNNTVRPAVGYVEQTGYDGSDNPTFSSGFFEPIFDNINIKGRICPTVNPSIEMTTVLLEGKITANVDGCGPLRIRNHSANTEARINVERSTFIDKPYQTSGNSGIDFDYMSTSLNTWIGKSFNEINIFAQLPAQAFYQREGREIYSTGAAVGSPIAVKITEVNPVGTYLYTLQGVTNNHSLSGVLQVLGDGTAPLGTSSMLWFESTATGSAFGTGNITISGVALNAGFLEITFASGTAADLDFMGFTLSPLLDNGVY